LKTKTARCDRAEFITKGKIFSVNSLPESAVNGKRLDPAAQREILIHGLRAAVSKTKLITATLETISVQLRHRQITTEQAIQWARDEGVERYLQFGPTAGAK
jgi:hypothetical protein